MVSLNPVSVKSAVAQRYLFTSNGKIFYALVPEYTHDGGHLNSIGRKLAARQLLLFLADLSSKSIEG